MINSAGDVKLWLSQDRGHREGHRKRTIFKQVQTRVETFHQFWLTVGGETCDLYTVQKLHILTTSGRHSTFQYLLLKSLHCRKRGDVRGRDQYDCCDAAESTSHRVATVWGGVCSWPHTCDLNVISESQHCIHTCDCSGLRSTTGEVPETLPLSIRTDEACSRFRCHQETTNLHLDYFREQMLN